MEAETTKPVSSHLVLSLLLTITFSTIAQNFNILANHPANYQFPLHSIPLLSFTEILDFPLRIVFYSSTLRLPLAKIIKIAAHPQVKLPNPHATKPQSWQSHAPLKPSRSWPRYILFILCPLPAAMKLISLTGIPCTKALGMMSFTSFILTEIFMIFPGPPQSLPPVSAIVGYSEIEWEMEAQEGIRSAIERGDEKLSRFQRDVRYVVLFLHALLILYATMGLWRYFAAFVKLDTESSRVCNQLIKAWGIVVYIGILLTWVLSIFGCGCIPYVLRDHGSSLQLFKYSLVALWSIYALPRKTDEAQGPFMEFLDSFDGAAYIWLFFWVLYQGTILVVRRYPRVGKALMIVKEIQDADFEEGEIGDIMEAKWVLFCLFLIDLIVCVLWYLVLYDEKGTVDPKWKYILWG